ncbi:MAG: type I 3-dehydroquinate dehydratase [Bacteroidales bacterium]|nr:type I 3-dehydroquinate dehydratase [Bacteroidales bacterium]
MICVSIGHISQVSNLLEQGIELIELRLDLIKQDPGEIFALLPDQVRSIVTCRPEGFSDRERSELLKTSLDLGASYIDIEVESSDGYATELIAHAQQCGTGVIFSYHNFQLTPGREELENLMKRCLERGGDITKIATCVITGEDIGILLSLYDIPCKKVVIGMGPLGRITRVMAPYLGAEFTFASLDGGDETAPGQLTVNQLNEIYNVINKS